jgi:hypothetical protein
MPDNTGPDPAWQSVDDGQLVDALTDAREINRALPAWILSVLRKGAPGARPKVSAVWGKVVTVAMSARRRGWTQDQFIQEMWSQETRIFGGGRKVYGYWPLMTQVLTTVNGSPIRAQRQLDKAWATAGDNLLTDHVLKTPADFLADTIEWAGAWEDRLDSGEDNLTTTQKLVMLYVTASVVKRQNSKVTCPSREVGAAVGITRMAANRALRKLAQRGFLVLHDRGVHSKDPWYWKAAIYSLGDPYRLRQGGRRKVGHRTPLGSTPMSQLGPDDGSKPLRSYLSPGPVPNWLPLDQEWVHPFAGRTPYVSAAKVSVPWLPGSAA